MDTSKLGAFVGKMVGDVGAAISAALVMIGDRTGLYRALDTGGPQNPAELAKRSGKDERSIAEWLGNQAASGYVTYDAMTKEPFANDKREDNHTPGGRVYFGFSTMLCTPSAKSQPGGYALGAQAGEARMREVAKKAGLTRFRRATETPFNIVYEMRP
jgi:hypothetical protein